MNTKDIIICWTVGESMANYYNNVITAPVFHGQTNEHYFCTSLYYTYTYFVHFILVKCIKFTMLLHNHKFKLKKKKNEKIKL